MRADTRTRELSGDLLRLQRAYDRVSQELSTHRWVVLGGGRGQFGWVGSGLLLMQPAALVRSELRTHRKRGVGRDGQKRGERASSHTHC